MMVKCFWNNFIAALAALSSVATLVAFIYKWENNLTTCETIIGGIIILLLCGGYGLYQIKRKKKIELQLGPQFIVTIKEGDLLSCEGVIVIPVNEYFDTIVDDVIIAKNTVHGKFINQFFSDRINELDQKIEDSLNDVNFLTKNNRKNGGKTKKYPLGTCAKIRDGKNCYILLAMTHFDEEDHAYIDTHEFKDVIYELSNYINKHANSRPVYMPLMGTGQSGIKKPAQRILLFILTCLEFMNSNALPKGLNIIIYSGTMKKINLNLIEDYYNNKLLN